MCSKPIKLGVIFDQRLQSGGGYQQSINAAKIANSLPLDIAEVQFFTTIEDNISILSEYGIEAEYIFSNLFVKAVNKIWSVINKLDNTGLFFWTILDSPFERKLKNCKIDLVYFLSPSHYANQLTNLNYILTVWDLSHFDEPEFPEVRNNKEFQKREQYYKSVLPRATAIIVDSNLGKENITERYSIPYRRIHIIPFEPSFNIIDSYNKLSNTISVSDKYGLNLPYIFYPAQFWAHKNHIYILNGLKYLEDYLHTKIGAVFCGSDKFNKNYVASYAIKLNLENRVVFTGFVENEEIVQLYKQSLALVMPSYFGPTNLPPLEAFHLKVPVIYSNLPGLREQVGDAALLLDLKDPSSLAYHLKDLISDNDLRDKMIVSGQKRIEHYNAYDRKEVLSTVVKEFRQKRICWEF